MISTLNRSLGINLIMAASCSQQEQQRCQATRQESEQVPSSCWMFTLTLSLDHELSGSFSTGWPNVLYWRVSSGAGIVSWVFSWAPPTQHWQHWLEAKVETQWRPGNSGLGGGGNIEMFSGLTLFSLPPHVLACNSHYSITFPRQLPHQRQVTQNFFSNNRTA